MKNIILIITVALGMVLFFSGCEKNDKEPKVDIQASTTANITNPVNGTSIVLTLADSANPLIIEWSETNYVISGDGALPIPSYSLQLVFADSSFDKAKELVNTKELLFETIFYKFNNTLLSMGMAGDSTGDIELRVVSSISGTIFEPTISEIIRLTVTTFEPPVPPPTTAPKLWVPGDYQGWSPATAPNIFSYTYDEIYKGYIYFPETAPSFEFKFTTAPDWDHTNFGFASEGVLSKEATAGNLTVPAAGGYWVEVDTLNLTWTKTAQSWGVIGEWLTWTTDINMNWDDVNHILTLTIDVPDATNNRFKFRANDDWAVNLGAQNPDDGTLVQNGADIPIPAAGNYTFILDFKTELPTYQLIAN